MRVFSLLTKLLVFLLLLGFAVKNIDSVTVRYFLGLEWQAPLAFVLLVFFAAGVVADTHREIGQGRAGGAELVALARVGGDHGRRLGEPIPLVHRQPDGSF